MPELVQAVREIAEKITVELAFVQPGKDSGLLPINCLLQDLEHSASPQLTPELRAAVAAAREAVDNSLDSGAFSSPAIQLLTDFVALLRGGPPPSSTAAAPVHNPELETFPQPSVEEPVSDSLPVLPDLENAELLAEFISESSEHLDQIELAALNLEKTPNDPELLNALFRAFHSIKGGSGFLRLLPVQELAHQLESLLDQARRQQLEISPSTIDLILQGRDLLRRFLAELAAQLEGTKPHAPITWSAQELLARLRSPQARAPSTPSSGGANAAASAKDYDVTAPDNRSIKVDVQKLDALLDMVGELIIAQALAFQSEAVQAIQNQQLTRNLTHLRRITSELQKTAMSLRMVPIRATFQKFPRLVRDLAGSSGKEVQLQISGEDTELDRNIVAELHDPLVHLLRNAVDHGIEPPPARQAQGKPPLGTISLRAYHQSGNIVIEIQDDGAGLNPVRIRQKAQALGLISPEATLSEQEIFNFIFVPGFSTAEKLTAISGRGVGMDVVRRNLERLRAKIDIRSAVGHGATFRLTFPLTLAIIECLIVELAGRRFILPAFCVRESFRPTAEMLSHLHGYGELMLVRGQLTPVLRLHQFFGIPHRPTNAPQIALLIQSGCHSACLVVDRLVAKQEVVIKSLGDLLASNRFLAGGAILGDGQVGLILDVEALLTAAQHVSTPTPIPALP